MKLIMVTNNEMKTYYDDGDDGNDHNDEKIDYDDR